jgi:DNA-binding response OmpR family regulator
VARSAYSDNGRLPGEQRPDGEGARGRVLIIEPDPLTRWSMSTYLKRWFDVTTAESAEAANPLLGPSALAALILADELPGERCRSIEHLARQRNPALITVHTVTGVARGAAHPSDEGRTWLEKPFELACLARLLGVPDAEIPS